MKILLPLIAALVCITTHAAMPIAAERLSSTSLQILGKGLENKKTHELIHLACVETVAKEDPEAFNCSAVRAVYFDGTHTDAYFFGPKIKIAQDESDLSKKDVRLFFKKLNRLQHQKKQDNFSPEKKKTIGNLAFLGVGGAFIGSGFLIISVIGGSPLLLPAALVGSIYGINELAKLSSQSKSSTTFLDQNGWNWSIQPKKVSENSFKAYVETLEQFQK